MVRHDLHLQDGEPMAFCSIKEYFLQTDLPPLVQDLPPVLRTEDNVVLTAIYQMVCFMVLFGLLIFFIHNSIILQKLLSYKKNGTFIRYPKGIGRFHPHGHKILGAFPLGFCKMPCNTVYEILVDRLIGSLM